MIFIIGLLLIICFFFLFMLFGKGKPGIFTAFQSDLKLSDSEKSTIQNITEEIKQLQILGKPSQMKEAIIKSDNLIDFLLKKQYPRLSDKNMGERLKASQSFINDKNLYNNIWYAHKVRNSIVHDVNFFIPHSEAQRVLKLYQEVLEYLGIK